MTKTIPPSVLDRIHSFWQTHRSIVLVTGVFDVLHGEHETFLQKAKLYGDVLIVGVESDVRVRAMKGPNRPVHTQEHRCQQISNLQLADVVFVLPEVFGCAADHLRLINAIKPQVLAVSAHTAHLPEKMAILAKVGGQVIVVHEHNPKISTTLLLDKAE